MTVQFIAVDALEAAFAELLEAVSVAIIRAVKFRSILKSLAITLSSIQLFYEIEKLSQVLDRPASEKDAFTDRLEEGAELVRRCFKVKWWHYCKRYFYAKKLKELETSLLGFFQMEQRHILVIPNHLLRLNPPRCGRSVSFRPCGAPQVPDFVVGLDVPLQRLKTQLLKPEASVVLLSAPAGCGKTTLAKMVCHDHEIEERFEHNILFVTVSNKPNLNVIVKNLFQHLVGLVPEFRNDSDAIIQLENLLKQTARAPTLLVLDDVWSDSKFVVEKFQFQISGYKILVTSRDVFSRFDINYNLELLDDQDAMALFCRSAFPQCRSVAIPDDLVSEIVRGCKGFPLALKVVGRSLRGQPEVMWRRTLKQWSQGQSIFNFNSDLHICLKTSLDA